MRAAGIVIIVSWVVYTLYAWATYWKYGLTHIFSIPLEIWEDPFGGAGSAFGYVGLLVLGIWLYKKGKKKQNT